ncbi:hypothetical protein [Gilvibacter sp. SZ-19]|uniref:hypothetical protein n=1 Tax=unclassified Gilvibacter TaxID=2625242 RepID=UPI000B3D214F|nr:hypothetical protein [Gilvibacter sp. SZ-19]ARV11881.1 hypothetical protein BTO09_05775 [Gilvibacter sp. SZ-19]
MKYVFFFAATAALSLGSCKEDDVACVTCDNELTQSFTLCREANGDASVNGQDTDTDYDVYLSNLTQQGTSCN